MVSTPGKSYWEGMTRVDLMKKFPDEEKACKWVWPVHWKEIRTCPYCGSDHTAEGHTEGYPLPYRCRHCKPYFSVNGGTIMERSKISRQKWAIAIDLHRANRKGVRSMELHREIGITQKTAWFMR